MGQRDRCGLSVPAQLLRRNHDASTNPGMGQATIAASVVDGAPGDSKPGCNFINRKSVGLG